MGFVQPDVRLQQLASVYPGPGLLPFASELGAWNIYLDTNRGYKRHERAQLVVGVKVRRISISR